MRKFRILIVLVIIAMLALFMVACDPKDPANPGETVSFTITFNTDGGSAIADITVTSDATTFALPANPTKEGYNFGGWFFDYTTLSNVASVVTILGELSATDTTITVYAKWVEEDVDITTYTITFDTDEGSVIADIDVQAGATLTLPAIPTKTNYTFDGWYLEDTFATEATIVNIIAGLSDEVTTRTVYAKWVLNTYTVTFDGDGGILVSGTAAVQAVNHGSAATAPVFVKTGYVFLNWDAAFDNITEDVTITANWMTEAMASARFALNESMKGMYYQTSSKNAPEEPSATLRDDMALVKTGLGLISDDNEELLEQVQEMITVSNAVYYIYLIVTLGEMDVEGNLLKPYMLESHNWSFIDYFEDENEVLGIVSGDYENNVAICQTIIDSYGTLPMDMSGAFDYKDYLNQEMEYGIYLQQKAEFDAFVENFVALFFDGDILPEKIQDLATYLLDYDYELLMEEKIGGAGESWEYTYFEMNKSTILPFLLGAIDASGFTTDDMGLFLFKMINLGMDKLAEKPEMEDIIFAMKSDLSVDFVADFAQLVIGILGIIDDNQILNLIDGFEATEDAPTIAEIASLFAAIKGACDDFISQYDDLLVSGIIDNIITIINNSMPESELGEMITTALATFEFDASVQVAADIFGIFDLAMLNEFLVNDTNLITGLREVVIRIDNENFLDNLVILEAKLLQAVTGGVYSEIAFTEMYNNIAPAISDYVPMVMYMIMAQMQYDEPEYNDDEYDDEEDIFGFEQILMALPHIAEMMADLLKDRIIISDARFATIMTTASLEFGTHLQLQDQFEASIIPLAVADVMERSMIISDVIYALGMNDMSKALPIAAISYILDIDAEKLSDYRDIVEAMQINSFDPVIIAELIYAIFDAGFTNEEIIAIFTKVTPYVFSVLDVLSMDEVDFNLALNAFSGDIEVILNFAIEMVKTLADIIFDIDVFMNDFESVATLSSIVGDGIDAFVAKFDGTEQGEVIIALTHLMTVIKEYVILNSGFIGNDLDMSQADTELIIETIYDMTLELFAVFGFDGTVGRISDIVVIMEEAMPYIGAFVFSLFEDPIGEDPYGEQYYAPEEPGEPEDEVPMPDEIVITFSKIIVAIFGENFGSTTEIDQFADFIAAAGEFNPIADMMQSIIDIYDSIIYMANMDYELIPDYGIDPIYDGHFDAIMDMFMGEAEPEDPMPV